MENKFINTEGEVQITYLFTKLKSSFKYIVAVTMVAFILIYALSAQFAKPKYSNNATLIANYEANSEDTGVDEINAARNLAEIYATLIRSNDVMFAVIKDLDLELDPKELEAEIDVEIQDRTPLIVINYTDKDAEKGLAILNSLIETDVVQDIINTKQVTMVSAPTSETQIKHEPSNLKNALILSVLAGVLTTLAIFVKELFNNKIYSPKQVQVLTNIPLIGLLNSSNDKNRDDFLNMRTKLLYTLTKNNVKKVSFTSPHKTENLSAIIHNLAKKVSELTDKVLIIEFDNDSSNSHDTFELSNNFKIKQSKEDYADFIFLTESDISKLLHNKDIKEKMNNLESNYEYVFINSGSVNTDNNSLLMSQLSEVSVLVLEQNKNTKNDLYDASLQLDAIESEIIGIVFNNDK